MQTEIKHHHDVQCMNEGTPPLPCAEVVIWDMSKETTLDKSFWVRLRNVLTSARDEGRVRGSCASMSIGPTGR